MGEKRCIMGELTDKLFHLLDGNIPDGMKIPPERLIVAIDDLIPNDWNPNRLKPVYDENGHIVAGDKYKYSRLKNGLLKFGQFKPLIVRNTDSSDTYEILDGQQRWEAMKEIKFPAVIIDNLGDVPDAVAKQITILSDELRGKFDYVELSKLIIDLEQTLNRDELLQVLPYRDEELQSLEEMLEFEWEKFEQEGEQEIEEDEKTDNWIDMVFTIPENALPVIESEIERIMDFCEKEGHFKKGFDNDLKRGLVLEKICVLSATTSLEELK